MNTQQVVLHSQSPLPNVQQNIRQGDLLFVRVMKNLGGGNYLASFAGGRFTVKSTADFMAGQTFRARVEIANGKLLLVPQMQGANGANQNAAISVQNFNALSGEVAAFLASMGLEADGVAQRILQFLMQSGAKINPSLMQKARRLASKYKGREAEAAEAALVLEQKGIDAEDALDEIMSLLDGGQKQKQRQRQDDSTEATDDPKTLDGQEVAIASEVLAVDESQKPASVSESASDILTEFNSLPQKNTDFPNKSWVLVPFEFEANSTQKTGNGVLRLFIDTEKNVTEKCVINFKFSGKNLYFVLYYKERKAVALNFSGEGLDLDSAELKAGLDELGSSLGEGLRVEIVPFEEFSAFATENRPLSAVEGFA